MEIQHQQSSRWQRLAALPAEQFGRWFEETRAFSGKVTEAEAFALASRITPGAVDHHLTFGASPAPNGAVPTNVALEVDCL